jgi:hypothetical protein
MFNMMLRLLDVADDSDEALPLNSEEDAVMETLQARVLRHMESPEAAPEGPVDGAEGPS